jgi:hypothetical protein
LSIWELTIITIINQNHEWNTSSYYSGFDDEDLDDELDLMSDNMADSIITMLAEGADKDDVKQFIYDYLEDNAYY